MKFLSVCSGIEAASVAWNPLGWEAEAFSEIEPFPCAVLKHHYPNVPNLGDITKHKEWKLGPINLLCGGTPCQSFSVAGLRKGMADPRGNLALVFLGIVEQIRPSWVLWENVPGVLSSGGGRDFGSFLGGLGLLGYGWDYRVFDAQYFGLAQRRKRVFVVGYFGDWRPPAAVLFEPESLSGNPPPSRKEGKGVTRILEAGARTGKSTDDIRAGIGIGEAGDPMFSLQSRKQHAIAEITGTMVSRERGGGGGPEQGNGAMEGFVVSHSLRADGFDASEDGTGRGTPLVAGTLAASGAGTDRPAGQGNELDFLVADSIRSHPRPGSNTLGSIAFTQNQEGDLLTGDVTPAMGTNQNATGRNTPKVQNGVTVRRLTPRECERLQGFPDDYTLIPYRGKPAADGPRYKALGNSWAVPVVRWIGRRIQMVEEIITGGNR